jgi:hypothetical protein
MCRTMAANASCCAELAHGEGDDAGVYMARWVNRRGEIGPWSEITTATVAA